MITVLQSLLAQAVHMVAMRCRSASGIMRKVSSGKIAPKTIRVRNSTFARFAGCRAPQLYAPANSNGATMLEMERRFDIPAAISPRPKPWSWASPVRSVSTPSRLRSPMPVARTCVSAQQLLG